MESPCGDKGRVRSSRLPIKKIMVDINMKRNVQVSVKTISGECKSASERISTRLADSS